MKSIESSLCNLTLKIEPFYYADGTCKKLPCLYGTIANTFKCNRYNTPVEIWLEEDYPVSPPKIYVKPTSDMHVSTTSRDVQPDGLINIPYLKAWDYVKILEASNH